MDAERLKQIHALALELLDEIEDISAVSPKFPHPRIMGFRLEPAAIESLRIIIDAFFIATQTGTTFTGGHQENELEAAGIANQALMELVRTKCPHLEVMFPGWRIATKFRRIDLLIIQAAPDEYVPAIADQLCGRGPFKPMVN